jgi:hypothetical protein
MFKLSKLALIGALSVAFVSCGSVAYAADPHKEAYVTVGEYLKWHTSDSRAENRQAMMYMAGAHDALAGLLICTPPDTPFADIEASLASLLADQVKTGRNTLESNAAFLATQALIKVFPCHPRGGNL